MNTTNTTVKVTCDHQEIITPQLAANELARKVMNKCNIKSIGTLYNRNLEEADLFKNEDTFPMKGILIKNKTEPKYQLVHCQLKDEQTGLLLKIIINKNLYNKLDDATECIFRGLFCCDPGPTDSSITIKYLVTEYIDDKEFFSKDMSKIGKLLTIKSPRKIINIEQLISYKIQQKVFSPNSSLVNIGLIVPNINEIEEDIEKGLNEFKLTKEYIHIDFHRVPITSLEDIQNKLKEIDTMNYDLIGISRGGGEKLEVFNSPKLCELVNNLSKPFITGIAHTGNRFCIESFADKNYSLPFELGSNLSSMVRKCIIQINNLNEKKELEAKLNAANLITNQAVIEREKQLYREFEGILQDKDAIISNLSPYIDKCNNLESRIQELEDKNRDAIARRDAIICNLTPYKDKCNCLNSKIQELENGSNELITKLEYKNKKLMNVLKLACCIGLVCALVVPIVLR